METAIIMLILTMMNNGQMSAAFVATGGQDNCKKRAAVVRSILFQNGMDIRKIACLEGKVNFERFSHQTPEDAPRYHYLVRQDGKLVEIVPAANESACLNAIEQQGTGAGRAECVTSTQKPTGR